MAKSKHRHSDRRRNPDRNSPKSARSADSGSPVASSAVSGSASGQGIAGPLRYLREVRQEFSRVIWPKKNELVRATLTVFVMASIAAVFFLVVDEIISRLVQLILSA